MRGTWALGAAGIDPLTAILALLVAVVGALAIHWMRGGRRRQDPVARHVAVRRNVQVPTLASPPLDPSLPDWSKPESVMLDEAHLSQLMRQYAARAGIPETALPKADLPDGGDGNFVFRDKFGYVYATWEGGRQTQEYTSAVADQLLYAVFRDRAWMRAYLDSMGLDLSEPERTRHVEAEQERRLDAINPQWAAQLRCDRAIADGAAAGHS